jgi:chorismate mutase
MPLNVAIQRLSKWKLPIKNKILIAGPCSVESEKQMMQTAILLSKHEITALRGGIWKPRTHPGSFDGVGVPGLKWLKNAGEVTHLPVATEIAHPQHVEQCLKHGIDILWIGARTTTNPFAVQEIANALRGVDVPILIKNPINPDIELWIGAIERINKAGIKKIMAVHRGFSTYRRDKFRNPPIWRIPIELRRQMPNIPLICDPSHICGDRKYIFSVSQEAMDFLFDGLMIEVHSCPIKALSDAKQQITPVQYGKLIKKLRYTFSDATYKQNFQDIESYRNEIDVIDNDIIALLAKRMKFVREIGKAKQKHDMAIFQPRRWRKVLETRLSASIRRNLSREFIREIFEHIHEEALLIQETMKKNK